MNDLLNTMDKCGWATQRQCLTEADSLTLTRECQDACDSGLLRPAAVGRGPGLHIRQEIRGDHILWLDPADATVHQALYLAWLELLRLALNQRFFLGLFHFEGRFARYPAGAFYKPHLDRPTGTSQRIVTAILYLNPDWQPGDGGELKLWTTPGEKTGPFILIQPRLGTLVTFLAADYWHEVLPALKPRLSITGWFLHR